MKSDIDKIDEQIQSIQEAKKNKAEGRKVIVDRKYDYDSVEDKEFSSTDTKKIDQISDIEVDVLVGEAEDTKQMETVAEPTSEDAKNEPSLEEKKGVASENQKKEETPHKKKKIILYCILGLVIVGLLVTLILLILPSNKNNSDNTVVLTEEEKKQIIQNYGDSVLAVIGLYSSKKDQILTYEEASKLVKIDYDVECNIHEIYEDGTLFLDGCSINKEKVRYYYGKRQLVRNTIIPEGAIKIYVPKDGGVPSFEKPKDGTNFFIYGLEIKEAYSNLQFMNAENNPYVYYQTKSSDGTFIGHVVNYKNGSSLTDKDEIDSVFPIKVGDQYDPDYIAFSQKNNNYNIIQWGIYSLKSDSITLQYADAIGFPLNMGPFQPKEYVVALKKDRIAILLDTTRYAPEYGNQYYGVYDYTNQKIIINRDCSELYSSGDYLWCYSSYSKGTIYDLDGNKYFQDKYSTMYGLVSGKYLLVQQGSNVKLVTLNEEEIYDFGDYSFDHANYGIEYDKGVLFQFVNNTKGDDYDYDTDESCLEFIYHGTTKKGEVKETSCEGIVS